MYLDMLSGHLNKCTLWELYICISMHKAGLQASRKHAGPVFFLWQLCSPLVNMRLSVLVTSVSAALLHFTVFSLVATRGQPRSPSEVVFFYPFPSDFLCPSLAKCMEKSSLLLSGNSSFSLG